VQMIWLPVGDEEEEEENKDQLSGGTALTRQPEITFTGRRRETIPVPVNPLVQSC
jgi:hypothetical protein